MNAILLSFIVTLHFACGVEGQQSVKVENETTILEKVDGLVENVQKEIFTFDKVTVLDHHRMTVEAGVPKAYHFVAFWRVGTSRESDGNLSFNWIRRFLPKIVDL